MGEENNILEENVQAVEEVLDTIPKADVMDVTTSVSNSTSNEIWWIVAGAAVTGLLVAGGRWVYNKLKKRKKNKPEDVVTVVKSEPDDTIQVE